MSSRLIRAFGRKIIPRAYLEKIPRYSELDVGAIMNRFAKIQGDVNVEVEEFKGVFSLDPRSHLFLRLMRNGSYEPELAKLFISLILPDLDIIDVGANVGFFSVAGAKFLQKGRVLAIEPASNSYMRLVKNIERNEVASKVIVVNGVASNVKGIAELNTVEGMEEYSSVLSQVHPAAAGMQRQKVVVPAVRIDDLVSEHELNPGLIKVDVEGAEKFVFEGAQAMLAEFRPVVISELSSSFLKRSGIDAREIVAMFEKLGYHVIDPLNEEAEPGSEESDEILCIHAGSFRSYGINDMSGWRRVFLPKRKGVEARRRQKTVLTTRMRSNYLIYQIYSRRDKSNRYNKKLTDIVVEGFPRSGNSWLANAVRLLCPEATKISSHMHSLVPIESGASNGLPILVTIRSPLEACISYYLYNYPDLLNVNGSREKSLLRSIFRDYRTFHRALVKLKNKYGTNILILDTVKYLEHQKVDILLQKICDFLNISTSELRPSIFEKNIVKIHTDYNGLIKSDWKSSTLPNDEKKTFKQWIASELKQGSELSALISDCEQVYDELTKLEGDVAPFERDEKRGSADLPRASDRRTNAVPKRS